MEKILTLLYDRVLCLSVTVLLFVVGLFFWLYLRFTPFRRLRDKRERGSLGASFRALSVALAGTLGIGNIAGVCLALMAGGAGAVFWMWVSALVAMIVKYAEIILAFRFRSADGRGGAMYYMREGLGGVGGKLMGGLFAFLCLAASLSMGGLLQADTVVFCAVQAIGGKKEIYGLALAILTAIVIFGGVRAVSGATSRLVPLMSALYIGMCVSVLVAYRAELPNAMHRIFSEALSPLSVGGGIGAFFTSRAVRAGVSRGLLSNEAGCGTAPLAHITSGAVHPVRQGRMGMAEVFVDTLLICTLTALAVLVTHETIPQNGAGMLLISEAFASVFGSAAEWLLCLSVFFFGYATIICFAYYGEACLAYFTASHRAKNAFRLLFSAFVFVSCLVSSNLIWTLTDVVLAIMTLLNLATLLSLAVHVSGRPFLHKKRSRSSEEKRLPFLSN